MIPKVVQNFKLQPGQAGLPADYPVPGKADDLLFYIQRNQNKNTVVYNLNRNLDGTVNKDLSLIHI